MPERRTKQNPEEKLIKVPAELVENVKLTESTELKPTENLLNSEKSSQPESDTKLSTPIESPQAVLQTKLWLAARFTFITFLIGSIPYMLAPGFLLPAFNHPMVRTCALGVLIWNLIGAALFANVTTRGSKILLFLVFALPLMTIGLWWFWALLLLELLGLPVNF